MMPWPCLHTIPHLEARLPTVALCLCGLGFSFQGSIRLLEGVPLMKEGLDRNAANLTSEPLGFLKRLYDCSAKGSTRDL